MAIPPKAEPGVYAFTATSKILRFRRFRRFLVSRFDRPGL
ncbi:hypothetical protein VTL71DRAFT_7067 [Oculimacula yallundae]|uniref:Uncharacterized protein n=1 Tax=Oculimacula yallundae TaxID=86028 RepID=A0ABR4BVN0_9HELO